MFLKTALLSLTILCIGIYFTGEINSKNLFKWTFITGKLLWKSDFYLQLLGMPGIYRFIENSASKMALYSFNRTNVEMEETVFDGVKVIVIRPTKAKQHPIKAALVYFHGGGWSVGTAALFAQLCGEIVRRLGIPVVSVDYRTAPEHVFPAAYDDSLTVLRFVTRNAANLGIDPDRIALFGDSAGANLALAVSYQTSHSSRQGNTNTTNDEGVLNGPRLLVLLAPTLQMADMRMASHLSNDDDIILRMFDLAGYICRYAHGYNELDECVETMLSNRHIDDATRHKLKVNMPLSDVVENAHSDKSDELMSRLVLDPRFSPLSALSNRDLDRIPFTIVIGCSLDPLLDEARLLASRMRRLGGRERVEYHELNTYHDPLPFVVHGPKFLRGQYALDLIVRVISANLLV